MANSLIFGFHNLKDLADKRVTEVGVSLVADAINQAAAEHQRQMDALMGLFVRRTTDFKIKYKSVSAARLQPLDDAGRARPIQAAGMYETAFPVLKGGLAWGSDRISRAKMTVQDTNDITAALLDADRRWVRDHILAALFAAATWTFTDDEHGSLTIQPLANGDSVTYQVQSGADNGVVDTHQLAQANAIDNSNDPFPTIYSELAEHPENSGEVVALVPTNLKSAVEGLSGFYPMSDPRLRLGANQFQSLDWVDGLRGRWKSDKAKSARLKFQSLDWVDGLRGLRRLLQSRAKPRFQSLDWVDGLRGLRRWNVGWWLA